MSRRSTLLVGYEATASHQVLRKSHRPPGFEATVQEPSQDTNGRVARWLKNPVLVAIAVLIAIVVGLAAATGVNHLARAHGTKTEEGAFKRLAAVCAGSLGPGSDTAGVHELIEKVGRSRCASGR